MTMTGNSISQLRATRRDGGKQRVRISSENDRRLFDYLSIWVFEYLSIWIYSNTQIQSCWVFEYLSIWVFEYLSIFKYSNTQISQLWARRRDGGKQGVRISSGNYQEIIWVFENLSILKYSNTEYTQILKFTNTEQRGVMVATRDSEFLLEITRRLFGYLS